MKIAVFLSITALVNADMDRIKSLLNKRQRQNYKLLKEEKTIQRRNSDSNKLRKIGLDDINGYGCWCYFDNPKDGRGAPIDPVDERCKALSQGYACAIHDYKEATGKNDCVPWEVKYNLGTLLVDLSKNKLVAACQRENHDLCAQYACMVEGAFVEAIFNYWFKEGGTFEHDNRHINGFDPNANCPINIDNNMVQRECCGELPHRFPYKPIATRACCGSHTYDVVLQECCEHNVLMPAGTCL